jgi:Na+-translocating ferredoxin:NAD+ oxidoreductase RNF subunit RnfB
MRMLADIHSFKDTLPGIDCGSCGSPTCRAFAEDVIKGNAEPDGCPIKALKELREGKDG